LSVAGIAQGLSITARHGFKGNGNGVEDFMTTSIIPEKRVNMGRGSHEIIQNCLMSFMDDHLIKM